MNEKMKESKKKEYVCRIIQRFLICFEDKDQT